MIVSTYQPFFSPFPGFFHKASLSDLLVILDQVQFPRGTTWITRNRFKNDQGTVWMTIPVWKKGLGLQRINEVRICSEGRWRRKHLACLKTAYADAPYFRDHLDVVERIFSEDFERLIDLNLMIISYLMEHLQIHASIVLQSDLASSAKGNELLLEICRQTKASTYLAQTSAKRYLDARLFSSAGIGLEFFRPHSPTYPQLWGDFVKDLSAFDLLFNCGPKSGGIMRGR